MSLINNELVIVRGAGDLATGVVYSLYKAHFKVIILETQHPSAIRRKVALSEAVYDGKTKVEDIEAVLVKNYEEALNIIANKDYKEIPILIDPNCEILNHIKPTFLIDAIIAKKNLGTNKSMAKYTIALGPGFTAGKDCDIVIETMRGHNLGRMYLEGEAIPNTGIPGNIGGKEAERVIHASSDGIIENIKNIGDFVREKEVIAYINNDNKKIEVIAPFEGLLRGIIRDGFKVRNRLKIADIDPRKSEYDNCFTISDKARNLGGAVLTAMMYLYNSN
ncbi:selenium-dependent molybdenum cofactor biosynthesis protein YqeB [uncultured Brachyspira sp.]|uniref:selenium-dependent molybdenum cofactor biosynthesis protein YqeB n=1 Tax=uncultured Brachyspira sp. TaxID=221953 RepID=UPI0025861A54|nr:selenium-dependent molybdenum cofactor biosynthesis protein YqeB [uncultured Brachyspira sp.]